MPEQFIYPTNSELRLIEQDLLPRLTENSPIFQHFPIKGVNENLLAWESFNNFTGLQNVRGLNGEPPTVRNVGGKRWIMEPGYYGECAVIDEKEITERRQLGQYGSAIDITDLVRQRQDMLLSREVSRIEKVIWDLVADGSFSVLSQDGAVVHTDQYKVQTFTANPLWSVSATSTPLADLRAVQLLHRGSSVSFGTGSMLYMNQQTLNTMLANTNLSDIAGRRVTGLDSGLFSSLNLKLVNEVLSGENLPTIQVYDEGYLDDNGQFHLFIPYGKAVLVGRRTSGVNLGEYRMTRNANNPNMLPGSYVYVLDSLNTGSPVPRRVTVHRGHNGGPVVFFPRGVVTLTVATGSDTIAS